MLRTRSRLRAAFAQLRKDGYFAQPDFQPIVRLGRTVG
jgi:hypothetical protein